MGRQVDIIDSERGQVVHVALDSRAQLGLLIGEGVVVIPADITDQVSRFLHLESLMDSLRPIHCSGAADESVTSWDDALIKFACGGDDDKMKFACANVDHRARWVRRS